MASRFKEAFEEEEHESSTSDSEAEELDLKPPVKRKKPAQQQQPSLEDLQEAGFRAGPSVLTVPEPQGDPNWDWGRGGTVEAGDEEDLEEREQNRAAATWGTERAVQQAAAAKQQAAMERDQAKSEHAKAQQERRETFQQREKRKRELGQAKKGKNYVEEEKRLLRNHNIYSGFDN